MNAIKKILACAILLSSVLSSSAQEDDKDEKKGKSYRATLFNQWKGDELFAKLKDDHLPLNAAKNSYTQHYKYKENFIELYKKGLSPEGEEIFLVAMRVPVPASMVEPLLILAWNNNEDKPVAKVIEFSPREFRYGSFQIVNFSQFPLGGYIGPKTNKIVCKPGQEYITSFSIKEGEATPIVFYAQLKNGLQKVFGSITIHRKKKRAVYLMYPEVNKLGRTVFQSSVIVDTERQVEED